MLSMNKLALIQLSIQEIFNVAFTEDKKKIPQTCNRIFRRNEKIKLSSFILLHHFFLNHKRPQLGECNISFKDLYLMITNVMMYRLGLGKSSKKKKKQEKNKKKKYCSFQIEEVTVLFKTKRNT